MQTKFSENIVAVVKCWLCLYDFMTEIDLKLQCEWALKWRAFYLYGLNEKGFGGNDNSNIDEVAFGKIFPPLSETRITEVQSILQRNNHVSSSPLQGFFEKINDVLQNNLYNSFNMIFTIRKIAKRKILNDLFYLK